MTEGSGSRAAGTGDKRKGPGEDSNKSIPPRTSLSFGMEQCNDTLPPNKQSRCKENQSIGMHATRDARNSG